MKRRSIWEVILVLLLLVGGQFLFGETKALAKIFLHGRVSEDSLRIESRDAAEVKVSSGGTFDNLGLPKRIQLQEIDGKGDSAKVNYEIRVEGIGKSSSVAESTRFNISVSTSELQIVPISEGGVDTSHTLLQIELGKVKTLLSSADTSDTTVFEMKGIERDPIAQTDSIKAMLQITPGRIFTSYGSLTVVVPATPEITRVSWNSLKRPEINVGDVKKLPSVSDSTYITFPEIEKPIPIKIDTSQGDIQVQFKGVSSLRTLDDTTSVLKVKEVNGVHFVALLTKRSLEEMHLTVGTEVWVTFKTTAVKVF